MVRISPIGDQKSDSTTTSASADGTNDGGRLARVAVSCRIACAILSTMLLLELGDISPGMPTRSPPGHQEIGQRKGHHQRALELAVARGLGCERHRLRAIRPQPHGVRGFPLLLADIEMIVTGRAAQSTFCEASPETKRRYCQKFSPVPARRRPCSPWITLAEMRRASSTRRGSDAASERLSPSARRTASISWSAGCGRGAISRSVISTA